MSSREYRSVGLDEHGDKCAVCGAEEDAIHHRDGDKTNNDASNLVPLCAEHHQKVHAGHDEVAGLVRELGKRPGSGERRPIQVSDKLADELHDRKDRGESYEDVIWGLIEDADRE